MTDRIHCTEFKPTAHKPTHTPGPWEIREVPHNPQRLNIQEITECGYEVASVWGGGALDNAILHNACLIAAAPDLLAALEAFVTQATKVSGFPQAYEPYVGALVVARAAIAKAKGE